MSSLCSRPARTISDKSDNVKVNINPETGDFSVFAEREVVEEVEDPALQISLADARDAGLPNTRSAILSTWRVKSKEFGRIATQNAKNVILQKIREEERSVLYNQYYEKEHDVVTGIVQRYLGRNLSINLGRVDALLTENEMVKGEVLPPQRAPQGVRAGGEGHAQGPQDPGVPDPSRAGEAPR